jgi:hypothetical protein
MKNIDFESITIRSRISTRGGGIEIDLTTLGYPGERMTAYQNYLGGGMLGRVCSDCTIHHKHKIIEVGIARELDHIAGSLKRHLHYLTSPDDECFESQTFEQNQTMPVSAY